MAIGEFRLRVRQGPDAGTELAISDPAQGPVSIGRKVEPGRNLLCSDEKVSRRHASIELSGDGFVLVDHNSTNRTRLNGRLVKPDSPTALHSGDEIQLGPDTVVVFEAGAPAAAVAQPPHAGPEIPPPRYEFGHFAVYETLTKTDLDRVDVAIDTRTGTRVALKRFATHDLPHPVRRRILEQAERAQRWKHPNIAAVLEFGHEGDVLYVASRLVDGVPVAAIQDRCPQEVDDALAAYVILEACAAVRHATEEEPGFVHRNLTPRNIMLGYAGEIVLINFGFAPLQALQEGTAKLSRSKAHYLAPEHRAQRGLDARSDVFSLGIILYELLAHERIDPRRIAALPALDTVRPAVPADLAALTQRATALRAESRFASAAEMELALASALQGVAPDYGPPEVTAWMIKQRLGVWH
jgi:hypothetical protein